MEKPTPAKSPEVGLGIAVSGWAQPQALPRPPLSREMPGNRERLCAGDGKWWGRLLGQWLCQCAFTQVSSNRFFFYWQKLQSDLQSSSIGTLKPINEQHFLLAQGATTPRMLRTYASHARHLQVPQSLQLRHSCTLAIT